MAQLRKEFLTEKSGGERLKKQKELVQRMDRETVDFIRMLNAERDYRAKTSGGQCNEPFVAPLLFRIHGTLKSILYLLSGCLAGILVLLLGILAKL